MVAEIPLTQGQVALVDDADFLWLSQWKWCASWSPSGLTFYAQRNVYVGSGRQNRKGTTVRMHNQLTGWDRVDHIDHNGLHNWRDNLRPADQAQNVYNAQSRRGTSRYKGVSLRATSQRWVAVIHQGGKQRYIGTFDTEEDAARAYNRTATELFGNFAYLNVIPAVE